MLTIIRVAVSQCKIRPEHTELYGIVTNEEIDSMATSFEDGTPQQAEPIHIVPDTSDAGMYWTNSGVIRELAAAKLFAAGNPYWEHLNAVIDTASTIPIKALLIKHNRHKDKTKAQRVNEAIYLIEQMPLTQGQENRIAPTTGKPFKGKTDEWIGNIVGLKEYAVTTIRRALKFKNTDPAYCKSLLDLCLDSWLEMKRRIDVKEQELDLKNRETNQKPLYTVPTKQTTPRRTEVGVEEPVTDKNTQEEQADYSAFTGEPPQEEPINSNAEIKFTQYKRYKTYCWDSITMPHVGTQTVQVCMVSTPYWELRPDYMYNMGLGSELLKEDFIKNVAAYFSTEMKRVLKKRGSLFINIGDTIKDGEFQTIPELLLAALKADGWHCVGKITWHKPKLPNNKGANRETVRLQDNTEMVYHFVQETIDKAGKCGYDYYPFIFYNEGPIPALIKKPEVRNNDRTRTRRGFINPPIGRKLKNRWTEEDGRAAYKTFLSRCKGDNEIIGGNGGSRAKEIKEVDPDYEHIAVMASYLPVIPILECSKRGDLILNNMSGSGTVGLCAAKLDRDAVQYDLSPVNAEHSLKEYAAWYKMAYGCDPFPAK